MSTDTIGPDGPPLSAEGWEAGVREMSTDDLRAALTWARRDGAHMRAQRDEALANASLWIGRAEDYRQKRDAWIVRAEAAEAATLEALAERDALAAELEALRAGNPQLAEAAGHIAAAHEALKGWAT